MPKKKVDEIEQELMRCYCNFCQSQDVRITKVYRITCRKCGKTRLVTARIR